MQPLLCKSDPATLHMHEYTSFYKQYFTFLSPPKDFCTVVLFRFQTEAPARFELVVGLIVLCWRISLGGFKKGTSSFAKQLQTVMSTTKLYKYKICTYIDTLHIIQLLNEFLKFGSVLFLFMSIIIVQNNKTKYLDISTYSNLLKAVLKKSSIFWFVVSCFVCLVWGPTKCLCKPVFKTTWVLI